MKFRRKPIVVDAEQWFPGEKIEGVRHFKPRGEGGSPGESWFVVTIHGQHAYLMPGDWVITEPDGIHHYPCKPDVFAAIYEPAG